MTISTSDTTLHSTSTTFTVTSTVNDNSNTSNNSYTFQISLNNPCTDTTLVAPSSPSAYTFNIDASDYTWTIPAWTQQDGCSHTETLTFSPALSGYNWISVSSRTMTLTSGSIGISDHGTSVTFTVTSTVDDSSGTSNNGYTF